jgi:23S rRNA (uracil1939-C5)-methyltransferase
MSDTHIVTAESIGAGGAAVARAEGKTLFIHGLMPGETAEVVETDGKKRWARASIIDLIDSSPDRVDPPCEFFGFCGGCDWQFAPIGHQLEWKRSIVTQQLQRIGGMEVDVMTPLAPSGPYGYRNRITLRVIEGETAMYKRRNKELVPIDTCHILEPNLRALMERLGSLDGVHELTARVGAVTGDRLVVIKGKVPPHAETWGSNVATKNGRHLHSAIGKSYIHEEVALSRLRITGDAFFQNNTAGAGVLVQQVAKALDVTNADHLIDLYAGGGLFSATVGKAAGTITAVEAANSAADDLTHNVGRMARVAHVPVEKWKGRGDIVVADPPRAGLQEAGVKVIAATRASRLAYVSCDPGTFARDARLLQEVGYHLDWVQPVDLFPQTAHIELVSRFTLR